MTKKSLSLQPLVVILSVTVALLTLLLSPKNVFAQSRQCGTANPDGSGCAVSTDPVTMQIVPFAEMPRCPAPNNTTCCVPGDCPPAPTQIPRPTSSNAPAPNPTSGTSSLPVTSPVTAKTLNSFNPLMLFGSPQEHGFYDAQGRFMLAGFINRLLSFLFPIAGLILFLLLVWGGFEMMTGAASKNNLDSGKQRIVAALIGFVLLFASYWIAQIVEYVTGVGILG